MSELTSSYYISMSAGYWLVCWQENGVHKTRELKMEWDYNFYNYIFERIFQSDYVKFCDFMINSSDSDFELAKLDYKLYGS